ncbi:MAG TPA: bifunctional diguanylate cyclase/phosphodiesterase [Streptosporangiaceae bacterium]|nr:bifunctional diguanylate cyclase/phosphodiesterase [Streptosporangiaceae bacterium]
MTQRPKMAAGYAIVMALLLASLAALCVLAIQSINSHHADVSLVAAFSAAVCLVVIWLLADLVASQQRALRRERVLRSAVKSLASAGSEAEVAAGVAAAMATLAGAGCQQDSLLAVSERGSLRPAGPRDHAPPARWEESHALLRTWLPQLCDGEPRLVDGTPQTADGHLAATDAGQVVPRDPGRAERVMLFPLVPGGRAERDHLIGVLAVFGSEQHLAGLRTTLETVAGQTGLALTRVMSPNGSSRSYGEAYFRALVQDSADVVLVIEDSGKIRQATPSAAGFFGDTPMEGAYLADITAPGERDEVVRSFTRMRDRGGDTKPVVWRMTRPDGSAAEAEVRCRDLRDNPAVGALVLTLHDVTEQHMLERELKHRAFHDSLTGLPNRLLFTDRIGHALARARRNGTTVGVIFVDLDDFKMVNETMGHGIGDELLVAAAARLHDLVRESDTAARLGADEFGLLVEAASDSAAVETFAERVVCAFGEPFTLSSGSVITTATVGIATTEDSTDAGDLVRHADLALYAAKAAGKRQWRHYQPVLSVGVAKRWELQAAIDDAVKESAFTLVYQPIVKLATGEVAGFEALLRWPHPRWGMIHPDQFIALAEETGHIVPLGTWVLERAVSDILAWQQRAPRRAPLYVSVNVSARQFANPGFVGEVRRVLAASGLAPSALLLELTESVLLRRDDRIRSDLMELKRTGVRLAIDDFGTGYSSLGYLRELPIDVLKIDKSFVEGIALSEQRRAIVDVIIHIARALGLTVMAEGIESEVQRDLLVSLGCAYGQGYLLERPVAADDAEALVRDGLVRELRPTGR